MTQAPKTSGKIGSLAAHARERRAFLGVLLLSVVLGLLYVCIIPPWQHHDEPTYFEYAKLISVHGSLPDPNFVDKEIRHAIAKSMFEHGFYRELSYQPNLETADPPAWIGQIQTGDKPLYFFALSGLLRLLSALQVNDITLQLFISRIFSSMLFTATLFFAYRIVAKFTQAGNPLRLGVPIFMTLLPGYLNLMTSVNNDVAATFTFSLFLWASTHLILDGPTPANSIGALITMGLCFWTKNTVMFAVPLGLIAFAVAFIKRWKHSLLWLPILLSCLLALAVTFRWGDAAHWIRRSFQPAATRSESAEATHGSHVFRLNIDPDQSPNARLQQVIPNRIVDSFRGNSATFGAWLWADRPSIVELGIMANGESILSERIATTKSPTFHAVTLNFPEKLDRIDVVLGASASSDNSRDHTIFLDGLVLTEGDHPSDEIPEFEDEKAAAGVWNQRQFTNRLRNGSAEKGWLYIQPRIEALVRTLGSEYLSPSTLLAALQDWKVTRRLYLASGKSLLQSFWGRFGWGHVYWPSPIYGIMGIISVLVSFNAAIVLIKYFREASSELKLGISWLGFAGTVIWVVVFLRGFFTVLDSKTVIPDARFVFPAIIPTALWIVGGWQKLPKIPFRVKAIAGLLIISTLELLTILTIFRYYWSR